MLDGCWLGGVSQTIASLLFLSPSLPFFPSPSILLFFILFPNLPFHPPPNHSSFTCPCSNGNGWVDLDKRSIPLHDTNGRVEHFRQLNTLFSSLKKKPCSQLDNSIEPFLVRERSTSFLPDSTPTGSEKHDQTLLSNTEFINKQKTTWFQTHIHCCNLSRSRSASQHSQVCTFPLPCLLSRPARPLPAGVSFLFVFLKKWLRGKKNP